MRKSADYIGLPVISIDAGAELGVISRLVVDPGNGKVVGAAVQGSWYEAPRFLPYGSIRSVGQDAVMVDKETCLVPFTGLSELEPVLRADVQIKGATVLNSRGTKVGTVKEYEVDEASGNIAGYQLEESDAGRERIPAEQVLTLGRHLVIVSEGAGVGAAREAAPAPLDSSKPAAPEKASSRPEPSREEAKGLEDLFRQRQEGFVIGKKAIRTVKGDDGRVLVEAGQEITQDMVKQAREAGKLAELLYSIGTPKS